MQTNLIKIGNSQGIRIPAKVIEAIGLKDKITLEIIHSGLIIKPLIEKKSRMNWAKSFKKMHENGDDKIIIDDNLDLNLISEFEW